jgi:hypothetical protein
MRFRGRIGVIIAMLCMIASGNSARAQAPATCAPVAECMQRMLEQTSQLSKDNQALTNRVSVLERELAAVHDAIKRLADHKTTLVDRGGDRDFLQSTFWTSANPSHVNYSCPQRNVLIGMEFEMSSDGFGRHPSRIKFICRELSP